MKQTLAALLSVAAIAIHAQTPPSTGLGQKWEGILAETGQFYTGQELFQRGRESAFGLGYVAAVIDSNLVTRSFGDRMICVPKGVTLGQTIDVVFKYLDANPERRHLNAAYLAREAMILDSAVDRLFPLATPYDH